MACSSPSPKDDSSLVNTVNSILVIPVVVEVSEQISKEQKAELYKGASFIDATLQTYLQNDSRIEFAGNSIGMTNLPQIDGGFFRTIVKVGREIGVDAVLVPSVSRFRQREGTSMSAATPAAASFSLTLFSVKENKVLWVGAFDESQQPLMDNLLSIGKVMDRGLKWITVEEMVGTALKDKVAGCPYL